MTLKTRLDCLKLCLLPGIRCGSSLQKQCFSSSVNGGIEQVNQKSPRGHDDDNELGKQTRYISDHSCVRLFGDWSNEHKSSLLENMVVFRDFIAESEEESILAEIGSYLKRMRYEFDHWDDVSIPNRLTCCFELNGCLTTRHYPLITNMVTFSRYRVQFLLYKSQKSEDTDD